MPRAKARKEPPLTGPSGMVLPAMEGAPWYVKLVIWLLVWFGFPVFMCVVLLMLVIGYIPSPITTLSLDMGEHKREMKKVLEYVDTSTRVQRQICRNTAGNPAERVECER